MPPLWLDSGWAIVLRMAAEALSAKSAFESFARVPGYDERPAAVRVENVETPIRRVLRVEGHTQESALPAGCDQAPYIEEGSGSRNSVERVKDPDESSLFHNEEARQVVRRGSHEDGRCESGGDRLKAEARRRRRWRCRTTSKAAVVAAPAARGEQQG